MAHKTRSAIGRFFGKIKENKRLALRFDKLYTNFFLFLHWLVLKYLSYFVNRAITKKRGCKIH
jgi:hypothetical protein